MSEIVCNPPKITITWSDSRGEPEIALEIYQAGVSVEAGLSPQAARALAQLLVDMCREVHAAVSEG